MTKEEPTFKVSPLKNYTNVKNTKIKTQGPLRNNHSVEFSGNYNERTNDTSNYHGNLNINNIPVNQPLKENRNTVHFINSDKPLNKSISKSLNRSLTGNKSFANFNDNGKTLLFYF
jgi:hypothetical protein